MILVYSYYNLTFLAFELYQEHLFQFFIELVIEIVVLILFLSLMPHLSSLKLLFLIIIFDCFCFLIWSWITMFLCFGLCFDQIGFSFLFNSKLHYVSPYWDIFLSTLEACLLAFISFGVCCVYFLFLIFFCSFFNTQLLQKKNFLHFCQWSHWNLWCWV